MHSHLDRAELLSRLLGELSEPGADAGAPPPPLRAAFARAVLRRVDDAYLYRHRMTTLGGQLRESFRWTAEAVRSRDVEVRAFHPRLDTHGYTLDGCVLETIMPDQPFIYDTLKLYMEHRSVRVHNSLHIILPVKLDEDGTLDAIDSSAEGAENVSYTRWFIDPPPHGTPDVIAAEVRERLTLATQMVEDFHRMMREVKAVADEFDYLATLDGAPEAACSEVRDFLAWLGRDNFVFMGISYYARRPGRFTLLPERGLGIARRAVLTGAPGDQDVLDFLGASATLTSPLARIRKSQDDSVIHRRGKVDEILVRTFDHAGQAVGGFVIHGMFTYKGLVEPGGAIPILRRKLQRILDTEGTVRASYEHKAMVHAFNALPVEYLFEADDEAVRALVRMILSADDDHEIAAHIAAAPDARSAYAFIVVPKENYSDDLRALLQIVLQAELRATYADHRVHLGKFGSVALHFYLTGSTGFEDLDLATIERKLIEVGTPWSVRVQHALEQLLGEGPGQRLAERYADAFGEGYADLTDPVDAAADIVELERVAADGARRFALLPNRADATEALLRIYGTKELLLTEILPIVDNFGVVVAEQYAFEVVPEHTPVRMNVNTLRVRRGDPDIMAQGSDLIAALTAVFDRRMRSDRMNRLLLPARLRWLELDQLRAYFQYARQLGSQLTLEIVKKTFLAHRDYVHDLGALLRARFDPDAPLAGESRELAVARVERSLLATLDRVAGYDEDRVLRLFLTLVQATVRTNAYRHRHEGEHYLSFKVQGDRVPDMPTPRPLYEIFVHHARLEGVHLRAGKVARGGLRWSDRLDDYRSEVLGLLTTQVLKNAFIVPTGAKGGFVLTSPPDDPTEARRLASELYRIFVRGLLDLTDNVVDGQIVPPDRVLRYDGDDPYLAVAADKGTTHLNDEANAVAREYGFWLDDAFASGSATGFDHKSLAIAAKGAWVAVRRHLLEVGLDPDHDPVSVVGIGDMSGDVFGNGMLLSRTLRLIGAFNHRWVFLDPSPDPERSFAERRRLFALPNSDWCDYDAAALSPGGGVFARGAKAIPLSREARARLGTDLAEVSGTGLIRLLLRAEVDLLWSAGVGTYIKSTAELDSEVGDGSNDDARVDAATLRCRAIGEPGNRGITTRGRVEFAERGGRVNLDAIDNAAGVALSDHEVNLKALLAAPLAAGQLTRTERDAKLRELAPVLANDVLADCAHQSLALSLDEERSHQDVWSFVHAMLFLREQVGFSPRITRMPRGHEVIRQRVEGERGFFRPELATLLCYAKMYAQLGLAERSAGSAAALRPYAAAYFPPAVIAAHGDALDSHPLLARIAATVQSNEVVDRGGASLLPILAIATERPVDELVAASLLAAEAVGANGLRRAIEASAPGVPTEEVYRALVRLEATVRRLARSLLWTAPRRLTLDDAGPFVPVRDGVSVLAEHLEALAPDRIRRNLRERTQEWTAKGFERSLAGQIARLGWLDHAVYVSRVAEAAGVPFDAAARTWLGLGAATWLIDLIETVGRQSYPDRWDFVAMHSIVRALLEGLSRMAELRLRDGGAEGVFGPHTAERWLTARGLDGFSQQIQEILRERVPIGAMLVVSERLKLRLR